MKTQEEGRPRSSSMIEGGGGGGGSTRSSSRVHRAIFANPSTVLKSKNQSNLGLSSSSPPSPPSALQAVDQQADHHRPSTPIGRSRTTTIYSRSPSRITRKSITSSPSSTSSSSASSSPNSISQQLEQLDLLEVIDPAVRAASTLTHIQNTLFIPPIINRFASPIIELDSSSPPAPTTTTTTITSPSPPPPSPDRCPSQPPTTPLSPVQHPSFSSSSSSPVDQPEPRVEPSNPGSQPGVSFDLDHHDQLDRHLINILDLPKRHTTRSSRILIQLNRIAQGVGAFIATPIGVLFTIYGILVIFWGAALTLILLGWWKIESQKQYRIWVEICSQILNGLFTIPGLGLFPSRVIDGWNISIILHYARVIWKRKGKKNLQDPNDLIPLPPPSKTQPAAKEIDPIASHQIVPVPSPHLSIVVEEEAEQAQPQPEVQDDRFGLSDVWKDDQEIVLNEKEVLKLRTAQEKLCRSQTWYRPHSSATHYAFPIRWAVLILLLNLGNSIFQAGLCVVMWGLRYSNRPAWTTATFMALSFSCGISSAILIWRISVRTLKSEKVIREAEEVLRATTKEKLNKPRPRSRSRSRSRSHSRDPSISSLGVINRLKRHPHQYSKRTSWTDLILRPSEDRSNTLPGRRRSICGQPNKAHLSVKKDHQPEPGYHRIDRDDELLRLVDLTIEHDANHSNPIETDPLRPSTPTRSPSSVHHPHQDRHQVGDDGSEGEADHEDHHGLG